MIYEIALFPVQPQHVASFRNAFAEVVHLLSRAKGYCGHFLAQGVEKPQQFTLIVRWQSLEDHTPGFEASNDHRVFMMRLQEYLSEEPSVYHIEESERSDEHDDKDRAADTGTRDTLSFLCP